MEDKEKETEKKEAEDENRAGNVSDGDLEKVSGGTSRENFAGIIC